MMEDKYVKFYKIFDKRFKNNKNLILCSKSLSDGGVGSFFYKIFDKRFKNNKNLILCSKSLSDGGVGSFAELIIWQSK